MTRSKPSLPHLMEFSQMVCDVQEKGPMELALLSMSYLDTALRYSLQSKFTTTDAKVLEAAFDRNGAPLGSLSGKVTTATALGLISSDIAREIGVLRRIRNQFAHGIHVANWTDRDVIRESRLLHLNEEKFLDMPRADGSSVANLDPSMRVSDGHGRLIRATLHNVVTDIDGRIGFYCPAEPSPGVEDECQRKYLTSFWLVMLAVAGSFVNTWSAESSGRAVPAGGSAT